MPKKHKKHANTRDHLAPYVDQEITVTAHVGNLALFNQPTADSLWSVCLFNVESTEPPLRIDHLWMVIGNSDYATAHGLFGKRVNVRGRVYGYQRRDRSRSHSLVLREFLL